MYAVKVKDEVVDEISEAYDYLESEQKGLGERLLLTIENCIEPLKWNPFLFEDDYRDIKKVRLSPFRYLIRYKI
jgi:hypothetical protein